MHRCHHHFESICFVGSPENPSSMLFVPLRITLSLRRLSASPCGFDCWSWKAVRPQQWTKGLRKYWVKITRDCWVRNNLWAGFSAERICLVISQALLCRTSEECSVTIATANMKRWKRSWNMMASRDFLHLGIIKFDINSLCGNHFAFIRPVIRDLKPEPMRHCASFSSVTSSNLNLALCHNYH